MLSQARNRWKRWGAVAVILSLFVYLGIYFFGNIECLNGLGVVQHLGLGASVVCVSGMLGTGAATLQYHSLLRDEAAQSLLQHAVDKQIKAATIAVTVQPIVGNTTSDIYQQFNTPEHHAFMCNDAVSKFKKEFFQMDAQQVEESITQLNVYKEDYLKVHPEHKNDYLGEIKRAGYEHAKEPIALMQEMVQQRSLPPVKIIDITPINTPPTSPGTFKKLNRASDNPVITHALLQVSGGGHVR